ncbi:GGDEF domain-containing protein [Arenimonas sp.]|uniref:GGDEF domain-containing protein n=1 Tax=Arenimonas sp. TaxID=1872635 RepID=UPI002E33DB08|nr:GGDEF domain-containing protein [Arenimonas sp.]HEX4852830.1 GGDEF domain-containing protein [Arenimonas sp.]
MAGWALALLWLALALAPPVSAATPAAFGDLLSQADALRSADPARFEVLLARLTERVHEATPAQRELLDYLKAYRLGYTGRFDLAIEAGTRLFETSSDPAIKVRAGGLVVSSRAVTREFVEGLVFLDKVLALVEQVDDAEVRHHAWAAAGVIHNQVGQYAQAVHYVELLQADGVQGRTRCFTGVLRLESLGFLDAAPEDPAEFQSVIDYCLSQGETMLANFGRVHLAAKLAADGQVPVAVSLLESRLGEIEATGYPRLLGEVHARLARLKLSLGWREAADAHALRAVANSSGIANTQVLVQAHEVLYENALARGDAAATLQHYRQYAQAERAWLDQVKARELAYQMARHESLQKSQTIELLNRQNDVLRLEQQVAAKTAEANRLLIGLLALLAASVFYWAYKVKRMQVSLRTMAQTDALTGVSNRHHFTQTAEALLEACRRGGTDAGLVMLDLDHFKAINDQYGHAAGDWALRQVAEACQAACPPDGRVGRLGGEEFALLVVNQDLASVVGLARECRKRIASIDARGAGHAFALTASFGVAGSRSGGHDFDGLLARADDALYRAKREGRDRVCVHMPGSHADAPSPASR